MGVGDAEEEGSLDVGALEVVGDGVGVASVLAGSTTCPDSLTGPWIPEDAAGFSVTGSAEAVGVCVVVVALSEATGAEDAAAEADVDGEAAGAGADVAVDVSEFAAALAVELGDADALGAGAAATGAALINDGVGAGAAIGALFAAGALLLAGAELELVFKTVAMTPATTELTVVTVVVVVVRFTTVIDDELFPLPVPTVDPLPLFEFAVPESELPLGFGLPSAGFPSRVQITVSFPE